jgi:hypothetical protein
MNCRDGEGITTEVCAEPAKAPRDAQARAVSPSVDDTGAAIGLHALDDQDVLERAAPAPTQAPKNRCWLSGTAAEGGTTLASLGIGTPSTSRPANAALETIVLWSRPEGPVPTRW